MVPDATALAGAAMVGTAWLSWPTKGLIGTSNRPMGTYDQRTVVQSGSKLDDALPKSILDVGPNRAAA